MIFNIIIIVGLELLGVCCFCLGFIFGRYSQKQDQVGDKLHSIIDSNMLDPITLQDQLLDEKLEKEVRGYAQDED